MKYETLIFLKDGGLNPGQKELSFDHSRICIVKGDVKLVRGM